MPRRRTPVAAGLAGIACLALAACTSEAPAPSASAPPTAVVHVPEEPAAPTTDADGVPIVQLPTVEALPVTSERIRGGDYAYSRPIGWSQAHPEAEPQPDTVLVPDDDSVGVLVAVDKPFEVGSRTLGEVVAQLREGFSGSGTLLAARGRHVAGYAAAGIVIDVNGQTRHLYYVVTYAERVYPIRVTYERAQEREAVAVLEAVLETWTWS